jgi:TRAP-type C4-dicarboxylate transport system substrate-binding protein
MNKNVWDSLPKETQAKLDKVFEEYNWRFINVSQNADDITIRDIYPRENVHVNYLSPSDLKKVEAACEGVWGQWVDAQVKKGMDRTEAQNAFALYKTMLQDYHVKGVK